MGKVVAGRWLPDDEHARRRRCVRPRRDRVPRPDRARRPLPAGGRALPPVRLARLPLGAPHADLPQAQGAGGDLGLSVTHWLMGEDGWTFAPGEGVIPDPVLGVRYLHELYTRADPGCYRAGDRAGAVGQRRATIVNNESPRSSASSTRLRRDRRGAGRLVSAGAARRDRRGERARLRGPEQRRLSRRLRHARRRPTTRRSDRCSTRWTGWRPAVAAAPFLCGEATTEADWRLFTTLVRFDAVYHGHFKCNLRRIVDYPALWGYCAIAVPGAGRRRDGRSRPHQAALLHEPRVGEPYADRAGRAGAGLFRTGDAAGGLAAV